MQGPGVTTYFVGAVLAAGIAGCSAADFTAVCRVPPDATAQQRAETVAACTAMQGPQILDPRSHQYVDILFVIDNSPSMAPKQKAVAAALGQFIQAIDRTAINYHIGVVTTDVGTDIAPGTPLPGAAPSACSSYAGDDGVLQNLPCSSRAGLGAEAAAACAASCPDPRFVPQHGARYIAKEDGITNVPPLVIDGVDVGAQRAFQCLALVGDAGCQVTQPLEAVRRALDRHRSDNTGFQRGSALLAVLFITDQDDCSVQLRQRQLLAPATPSAGQPACERGSQSVDGYCLNTGFRCLAKDLVCAEPMNTPGAKTGCKENPNTFLEPLDQYTDFFANLPNPNVVIAGIWPPSVLDNPDSLPQPKLGGLYVDYDPSLPRNSAGLDRGTQNKAACNNPDPSLTADPRGFFGRAQLRLSTFIRRFQKPYYVEPSICEPSGYLRALDVIADNTNAGGGYYCLPQVPKSVAGKPQCLVGDVDADGQSGTPEVALPVCSATCCNFFATDSDPWATSPLLNRTNRHQVAAAAACGAEPADCYCAVPSERNCGHGAVPGVWRKGNAAPPAGKVISFHCAY